MKILPTSLLLLAFCLSGCYTQLATRGHFDREKNYPAYGPDAAYADSLSGDSTLAAADTLAPPAGAPPVIVNNYYDSDPYHRGYARWEWEYPLLSFGYYSSHYGRYTRPYWWDDPWYSRRHVHRRPHGHNHDYVPARPAGPPGPYQSDKRLYNPDPAYKPVRKGRRSEGPASPPAEAAPAPKESSSSGSGTESGGSPSEAQPQKQEDKPEKEYRRLEKGRRR